MSRLIQTAKGVFPEEQLEMKEEHMQGDNDISIAREWYLNGELVRRDAWVTILCGQSLTADGGL